MTVGDRMGQSDGGAPTRIALSVARSRNRELLTGPLTERDVVEVDDVVPDGTDLCIVDETGLSRVGDALTAWRDGQRPVFAPVILLVESAVADPWEKYATELSWRVDGIVQIPSPASAITSRLDTLLERRNVSKRLAIEHRLTEQIFDTSPLAKVVLDTDGRIVRANRRAEELFELPLTALRGARYDAGDWTAVDANGDPIPASELPFRRVLETGEPIDGYEHGFIRSGRSRLWLSVNMGPIRNEDGDVEYVVGALENVTVHRAQERELERQLDLFQKAQSIADVGAWEWDVRTGEWYWSEQYRDIFDLSPDVDPGFKRGLECYHPEDRPLLEAAFERAVETGESYDLELRLPETDDRQRWIRTRGEPQYTDGELVRVRGALQDITDRKERELELRQMTRAVDEAPIGVVMTDPSQEDNPLTYVNRGFVELTGYSREEAIGRNCRFLQGEGTDRQTAAEIKRAVDRAEPVSVQIRNYRAEGSAFWNRLEIAPVRDEDGTVINFIGFLQNVTERVERQRQLQILDRYLRHNLRNKMNVVRGLSELLKQEGGDPATSFAERIDAAAARLLSNMEKARKITNVLRDQPHVRSVELLPELRSATRQLRQEYPDATLSLAGPDDATVSATKHLRTAFEELLRNAIEHNDGDSPTVDVSVVVGETGEAVVMIADDGPPIPAMEVDVLSGDREETALYHGQGLGLWLVCLIVQRSGGTLDFEANDPRGNVVTVTLPPDS